MATQSARTMEARMKIIQSSGIRAAVESEKGLQIFTPVGARKVERITPEGYVQIKGFDTLVSPWAVKAWMQDTRKILSEDPPEPAPPPSPKLPYRPPFYQPPKSRSEQSPVKPSGESSGDSVSVSVQSIQASSKPKPTFKAGDTVLTKRPIPDFARKVMVPATTVGIILGFAKFRDGPWVRVDFGDHGVCNTPVRQIKKV